MPDESKSEPKMPRPRDIVKIDGNYVTDKDGNEFHRALFTLEKNHPGYRLVLSDDPPRKKPRK